MKRPFTLIITLLVFSGCRNQGPVCDPFFGRTAVPPPGTGAASGGLADPYFRGMPQSTAPLQAIPQRQPGTSIPPPGTSIPPPGASIPPPGVSIPPPGASSSQGRTPTRAGIATAATTPKPAGNAVTKLAGRERVIQILQPRSGPAESFRRSGVRTLEAPTSSEPQRLSVPKRAIDIMDLPEAGTAKFPRQSRTASGAGGFRLVSGEDSSSSASSADESSNTAGGAAGVTEIAAQSSYAHDPGYGWLRGKLEYSEIDRCWKLRYIPVDGNTDKFGGSVVLPDAKMLAGCERGDFIEAQGKLGPRDPKKGGNAPTYRVAKIKRLGKSTP